jgi:hypothetical protein
VRVDVGRRSAVAVAVAVAWVDFRPSVRVAVGVAVGLTTVVFVAA